MKHLNFTAMTLTIFCYKKTFQTSYHLRYQLGLLKASPISASSNPIQKARGSRGMVLMVLWGNPNHFQKSAFLPPSPHTFEKAATEILQSVTVTKNIFSHLAKYNKHTRKRKLHFIPSWFLTSHAGLHLRPKTPFWGEASYQRTWRRRREDEGLLGKETRRRVPKHNRDPTWSAKLRDTFLKGSVLVFGTKYGFR